MLQGRTTRNTSKKNHTPPTPPPTGGHSRRDDTTMTLSSSSKKRTSAPAAAFRTILQDWWENDNVLAQVVASIADLRKRRKLIVQQQLDADDNCGLVEQEQNGNVIINPNNHLDALLHKNDNMNSFLTMDDLHLALFHTVRKHETALHNVRSLLAQQAQYQQALGRRLEEILTSSAASDATSSSYTRIYQVAAQDLYQKQTWAATLLLDASVNHDSNDNDTTVPPSQWLRTHPNSPWQQQIQPHDYPWEVSS